MIKILTAFFFTIVLSTLVYAKVNYSEMSTQELLSIIGYVKSSEINNFKKELELRAPNMNDSEKKIYIKNKDRLK